uniref:Response regulatory domain-containing protein n=1 Tax=Cyanidium caldarium TaxID=2771 RepID=Q9TLZ5_CYACA|nr:regulatory component of sensory transduction system [Cyanidium caldarium]AAF12972.1 unknown [Cyanidium caldarium]WDB00247.1 regulatory component of sensory transduction system [Cyanidium caldarium]
MIFKILVIDDENIVCDAIYSYLVEKGFQVSTCQNAWQAISILTREFFHLIILDIMMPQIDGYQFISLLRIKRPNLELPLILLTAKALTLDRIRGYETGCSIYLSKPFDPDELIAIINNLIKRHYKLKRPKKSYKLLKKQNVGIKPIKLTEKEQCILNLIAQGVVNKKIKKLTFIGARYVENYVSKMLKKSQSNNRSELVIKSIKNKIVI